MADSSSGTYTFYPTFSDFVTLYRGAVRVWIGDGTTGVGGKLYVEYNNGTIQDLGYVSDYETAKAYFAELGIELTYEQWVDILVHTPQNAERSEAWAVGTIKGTDVTSEDDAYHNNSKYYAEQSKIWTKGQDLDGQSVQPTDNATYWANEAHGWTNNKDGSVHSYSASNNAKYWAEQSKEYTNGSDLSGQSVVARATDNAEYFKNQAKLWANNGVQGDSPGANNNSRYWAEQAKSYADGKDLTDTDDIRPTDNSEYYKNQSKLWANFGTQGDSPTATNNSKYHSDTSHEERLQSESWAKGTREGSPDSVRQNASTDNSKYYSEQSHEENLQSESWAKGTRNGETDTVRQNASTDNSKYYSEESRGWAVGIGSHTNESAKKYAEDAHTSETNAATSESNAGISETNAAQSEENAEAWAKGTRNGTAVTSEDETYHNNSKYYSDYANSKVAEFSRAVEMATTTYQNSTSGVVRPTGTWTANPQPVAGRYMWIKTTFTWMNGSTTDQYSVSYIGANGTGSVNSVNGLGGDIILDGKNLYVDDTASEPVTIYERVNHLVTSQQIYALFA